MIPVTFGPTIVVTIPVTFPTTSQMTVRAVPAVPAADIPPCGFPALGRALAMRPGRLLGSRLQKLHREPWGRQVWRLDKLAGLLVESPAVEAHFLPLLHDLEEDELAGGAGVLC
jgi:hypothetical protein